MTDLVTMAAGIVADARRLSTTSTHDLLAICKALVETDARPQITNELAASARALIAAEATHTMAKGADGYAPLKVGLAREQAFLTFKSIFEEEFPNV